MPASAEHKLRALVDSPLFSGVISITYRGQTLLEHAHGLANREMNVPNCLGTRFATGSISKIFTAACLGRMVDAGLCRFDQPLTDILPTLRPHFAEDMTLASLLSHRSGLGDYIDDDAELPFAGMDTAKLNCPADFLPYVLPAERHPPGAYRYSSAGFILLGLAIEALAGEFFLAAMVRWVFIPAGLICTGFPPLDAPFPGFAPGYLPDGSPNFGHLPRTGGPDGGIVTTVSDLRRFFAVLRDGPFLSPSTREFLFQKTSQINEHAACAHGFKIIDIGGEPWLGHTGSDPGVSARVAFSAEHDSSIIILCNVESVAFEAFRLAREWLGADGRR
ncbi:MAG: serine hydrolase domain-containing protein [Prosthecobacter sp.]